jgi:hypothetical protein
MLFEMNRPPERIWHYWIDAEGHLWHEGAELDDPDLLKFFMEKMEKREDGSFHLLCQGEECSLRAEDVPYVVQNIEMRPHQIDLIFPGEYREALDPTTLRVGEDNVLYCDIRQGKFKARFNRKSYMELARQVRFDGASNSFYITLNRRNYPIQGTIEAKL